MSAIAAVEMVQGAERAASLLQPLRLKMLEKLATPDSAAGLARHFKLPRQMVNYHLRELEKHRLVELVEERRKGNCVERVVRATASSYVISTEALGPLGSDPDKITDRFSSSYLVALSARAIREIAVLQRRADRAGQKLATLSAHADVRFKSAADRNAFSEELMAEIARLSAKYHDETIPSGRLFRFYLGAYPAIIKREDEDTPAINENKQ